MSLSKLMADVFVQHRWLPIGIVVLFTVVAALGLSGKTFEDRLGEADASIPRDESRRLLREVRDQFALEELECLVVLDGPSLFTRSNIQAILAVKEGLEDLPQVKDALWVDDLPTLNLFGLSQPLLPETDAPESEYAAARQRVLANPLVAGQLVSIDGTTALLPLSYDWLAYRSEQDVTDALVERAESILRRHPGADLRVRLTGNVPLFKAAENAFDSNRLKFQVISYVLVFLLAVVLFRGWRAVVIVGVAPAVGIFWTTGILDFFQFQRNGLTSVVMPVLVTMVGMSDGIHVLLHIRRQRAAGMEPIAACHDALVRVGPACALTSLTTAIGFFSLTLAKTNFIQNFGHGCMWAVIICFVAIMTVIPLLCSSRLGNNIHLGYERDLVGRSLNRFGGSMRSIVERAGVVTLTGVVLTIVLSAVALTLRPDARMRDNLPSRSVAAQTLLHCDRTFGGIDFARVVVSWPDTLSGDDPQILEAVGEVERLLRAEPLLRHPFSIRNIVTALAPDDANTNERMSLLQLVPPPLLDLVYSEQAHRTLVNVRLQDQGVARYRPVFQRLTGELDDLRSKFPGFQFEVTGEPVVEGRELSQVVYDLANSLGTASGIIFVVVTLAYRSVRIGLISIIPNTLPLAITAASLVFAGKSLTFTSVCAFTVCIGIAVDDTIHFLTRFVFEHQQQPDVPQAIERTFHAVGAAMITTTLVLLTGFGSVLLSDLPTHRTFALMACMTMATALVADLLLLPAILAYFYSKS